MSRAKAAYPTFRRLLSTAFIGISDGVFYSPSLTAALRTEGCGSVAASQCFPTPCFQTFASRLFSSSTASAQQKVEKGHHERPGKQGLVAAEEEFSAITDKIPQRPVTIVEGTSYTVVILAALGPKEYTCYNQILDRIKDDPRVTIRLGTPISSYGTESRNRAARQRIPHNIYNDDQGREHVQLQFHARGPSGRALVRADMYKDGSAWKYNFLYLDMEAPVSQQVVLVRPGQTDY